MESKELVECNFTEETLIRMIKEELFVPYTRVGLENLCRIHGINTSDGEGRGYKYFKIWLAVAISSAFGFSTSKRR
jgi:hypothetical protein